MSAGQLRPAATMHASDCTAEHRGACTAVHPRASFTRRPTNLSPGARIGSLTKHTSSNPHPQRSHRLQPAPQSCRTPRAAIRTLSSTMSSEIWHAGRPSRIRLDDSIVTRDSAKTDFSYVAVTLDGWTPMDDQRRRLHVCAFGPQALWTCFRAKHYDGQATFHKSDGKLLWMFWLANGGGVDHFNTLVLLSGAFHTCLPVIPTILRYAAAVDQLARIAQSRPHSVDTERPYSLPWAILKAVPATNWSRHDRGAVSTHRSSAGPGTESKRSIALGASTAPCAG